MQNTQGNPSIGKSTQLPAQTLTIPLTPKQPVLTCFYSIGFNWYRKDFPANKTRINITEDPHNSDIPIGIPNVQNLNIIFQKLGSEWYAIESSNTNFMTVNGVPEHQVIFRANDKHVIFIDRIPFVFLLGGTSEAKNKSEGKPGKDEFSLVVPKAAAGLIYKKEKPCIIGPNEFCDNRLPNETASAFIFYHKNCCFLRAISSSPENPVTADGVNAETPVPLFDESKLIIGKYAADFHVLQDPSISKHDFKFSPEYKPGRLSLLSVNGSPDGKNSIPLPQAGKALNIGRDSHSDAHIESTDISRKHAQLIIYEHSALLFDCYSTNGTFVNGEKIAKRMLHPGDIVSFGDTAFLFCYIE
ncbi:MAG: FHA domain-containing protein [Lentisphaerae bacterium]|nr:FHA domain-containing protein [Lentisphaerota bacterium]